MDQPLGGGATAVARAHSNIALVKYWGKRDAALNTPAVGSISVTLAALYTDTRVTFRPDLSGDEFWLDGSRSDATRVSRVLDLVRRRAATDRYAVVSSTNNFPTGAGLASSASGFAALAVAAAGASGLTLADRELSILARHGSGSAARSIFGGFAEMHAGVAADGSDAYAEQLLEPADWPLSVAVAITERGEKSINSTIGMGESATTSPFYQAWQDSAADDLAEMRAAIAARDFARLGELSEYNCLKLHALMLSTRPALIYWNAATVAAMHVVRGLRADGVPAYFTIDAGPQVKVLCLPADSAAVRGALALVPGVHEVRMSALGPGAHRLE
ncbi:diphosphomevalonate decarboxylase [Cryobacterium psychrotolerans]|uniref:diphosphomevalonate decarboxylase n=1 Tax=Cryobacterium psychrotolerans TaxID=386301 RepID=A0A1G9B4R5_9MICO|nr:MULTISPECIES: diphosphomevalonate decarboxylase [Cryobacterium]TFD46275.1 diphosphomevalonate decarboxylase [Cryobacterium sp. TMT1-2-1]TFD84629.1 diphosphomevalonate decarboxylase [Cryobacterium psychrotolerans]SDK34488.1 diphosphomevalonate decarboxylase [Cryobacterium psychrotolerans]